MDTPETPPTWFARNWHYVVPLAGLATWALYAILSAVEGKPIPAPPVVPGE